MWAKVKCFFVGHKVETLQIGPASVRVCERCGEWRPWYLP